MINYLPSDFWGVAFTVRGSALPFIVPRSLLCALPAVLAALCEVFDTDFQRAFRQDPEEVPSGLITPFALLVALLTSFRLNNAHMKWEAANQSALKMHERMRWILGRLCATFPPTDENKQRITNFRRLLVLAGVVLLKHVKVEKSLDSELALGLVTPKELEQFKSVTTFTSESAGPSKLVKQTNDKHKQDKFPTKNRPGLVFFWLQREVHAIFEAHKAAMTPVRGALDADLCGLSELFEEIEFLDLTVLPLAYAQLTRLVCLAFLLILPFCANAVPQVSLSWGVIPLSIASNLIYFTVDHCASEMESPFGDEPMDVDLCKELRRMDKHTASLLAMYVGEPVANYNLYPHTRSTDADHKNLKAKCAGSEGSVYKLLQERAEKREARRFAWERKREKMRTRLSEASSRTGLAEASTSLGGSLQRCRTIVSHQATRVTRAPDPTTEVAEASQQHAGGDVPSASHSRGASGRISLRLSARSSGSR